MDFAVPTDHSVILKESEKKVKYLDLAREWKKLWNMEVTIIIVVMGALGTVNKGLVQGLEDLKIRDNPNYCIAEIVQNTLKSRGDLRRLVVTQNPAKNHQLMLI